MRKAQWRTFSIRVNSRLRKSVAVQARFPLSEDEWSALFAGLERIRAEDAIAEAVSVLDRIDGYRVKS